jgi:hypothetical protein
MGWMVEETDHAEDRRGSDGGFLCKPIDH